MNALHLHSKMDDEIEEWVTADVSVALDVEYRTGDQIEVRRSGAVTHFLICTTSGSS
jgi:hypothetical protein